jgi:hypothetical protein
MVSPFRQEGCTSPFRLVVTGRGYGHINESCPYSKSVHIPGDPVRIFSILAVISHHIILKRDEIMICDRKKNRARCTVPMMPAITVLLISFDIGVNCPSSQAAQSPAYGYYFEDSAHYCVCYRTEISDPKEGETTLT